MSTPFIAQTFSFPQPDGSTIQLRGWGDQHCAVFETLDGDTVTQNPATGWWEIPFAAFAGQPIAGTGR